LATTPGDDLTPNAPTPEVRGDRDLRVIAQGLVESEARYRSIVASMSEGVVLQDAQGRIIECNASAERILGLSREQMMGLTSLDPRWRATDAEGRPTRGEDHPIRVTLRTGEPQRDVVMGVQRADGTRVWVCVNTQPLFRPGEAQPFSVVATFADITEMKRAEAELRESEERFRSLYEHSIDGVLLTAPDGAILAANPEACRLLGRTEAEICAAGRGGVVDATDERVPALLAERARTGQVRGELTMIRGDGTRFPAEFASAIFEDRHGRQRTSLTFRDVSARRAAEAALEQARQDLELRVAERTRALGALLELCRDVASQLELGPLLTQILGRLRDVIDHTGAAVAILEDDAMEILDYRGPAAREKVVGARISLALDSGYRRVVRGRAPVIVPDVWADPDAEGPIWPIWDNGPASEMGYARSWLGVPLIAQGQLIGLLRLDHEWPDFFTRDDTERALAFASQVAVAIVNARLHAAAQRAAALAERGRLARELHDSVSQALYGIALGVHSARSKLGPEQQAVRQQMDLILGLAKTGLLDLRALIFELRPDALEAEGLVRALERHADTLRARYGLQVELALGPEPDLPMTAKETLYRIAQEASNNVVKHADAQRASIRLDCDAGGVTLEVSDDGTGFDPTQPYPGHLGLRSMRERAKMIGAALEIAGAAGQGTRVRVRVPAG
jgi:PAS domain S-box-containing protein